MFRKLYAMATKTPTTRGERPSRRFVPNVEALDDRWQPSALVYNGDVYVWGTSGADTVMVSYAAGGVSVVENGVSHLFTNTTSGRTLHFRGYEGNDYLRNTTGLKLDADMGAGNDVAYGGYGADTIVGGAGNDYIDGGWGEDFVKGDDGNDTVVGGGSDDLGFNYIDGGGGNDLLVGGNGGDYMTGCSGDDTLVGNGGNDVLRGDGGYDYLYGCDGDDDLDGGAGDHRQDYLYGGAGHDNLRETHESITIWEGFLPFSVDESDRFMDYDRTQDHIYL